jgi:hypothetical protein
VAAAAAAAAACFNAVPAKDMNDGADTDIFMGLQPHFRTLVIQDLIPSAHS